MAYYNKTATKKDWKHKGARCYYIDQNFRLWVGTIEEVGEEQTKCTMVNQFIHADKTPVKMDVPNNKLRQENT